jgi:AcrR family transcriptional regulator
MRADAVRNRERLTAAAAELFATRGVGVPLEDIAAHAGVSIGTLYNNFANRGALLDAVLPDRLVEVQRLADAAAADPDAWHAFAGFLDGVFELQARDRSLNEAIARSPVGDADVAAECGHVGAILDAVVRRAHDAQVLRADFGPADLSILMSALSQVIATTGDDNAVWRRHLGFVLDGLRAER